MVKEMGKFRLIMSCAVDLKHNFRTVPYFEPTTVPIVRMQVLNASVSIRHIVL